MHDSTQAGRQVLNRYRSLAEERPEEPALIFERAPFVGIRRTWADLMQRSDELASTWRRRGVHAGARLAVTLADHPDTLSVLLAAWQLDCVCVLLDGSWGKRRLDGIARHSGATHAVELTDGASLNPLTTVSDPSLEGLPADTAMLAYTSGSTGDPKGIPLTHPRIALTLQAATAAATQLRGRQARRVACSMRLSASGVLNLHYTWAAFSDAAVVVLPELSMLGARTYWHDVERCDIDQTFLVPALIELLTLAAPPRAAARPGLLCMAGSAPLSPRTHERFQSRFSVPLHNLYGLSETVCASFFGDAVTGRPSSTSIGQPWLLQARLMAAGGAVVEGEGEGELELSGPTVFDGYYRNQAATRAAFDGRWFRTGDTARRDARGNYSIVGRLKDAVMKGGFSVYLNEVEEAALALPGVLEAAAVPVAFPNGGEDLGLIVRPASGQALDDAQLLAAIREDLGHQRAPHRVFQYADRLPRAAQEKLDRKAIAQLWATLVARSASPARAATE